MTKCKCLLTGLSPFADPLSEPSTVPDTESPILDVVGGLPLTRCEEVARAGAGGPAARLATTMLQEYALCC